MLHEKQVALQGIGNSCSRSTTIVAMQLHDFEKELLEALATTGEFNKAELPFRTSGRKGVDGFRAEPEPSY